MFNLCIRANNLKHLIYLFFYFVNAFQNVQRYIFQKCLKYYHSEICND